MVSVQQREDGRWCIFDEKSQKFFPGGCLSGWDEENSMSHVSRQTLEAAQNVVQRRPREIVAMSQTVSDGPEQKIAQDYLEMNPDIAERAKELDLKREARKFNKDGKPRKQREPRAPKEPKVRVPREKQPPKPKVIDPVTGLPRGRGRPRLAPDQLRKKGPTLDPLTGKPRGRGRPRTIDPATGLPLNPKKEA